MGELEKIANAKAQASSRDIIAKLRPDMEALHRRHSVEGMGGRTIIESQALCTRALEEQGKAVAAHFRWVIEEGLWTSQSLVDVLASQSREHLAPVLDASHKLMKLATDRAGSPKLLEGAITELNAVRDRVWTDIALALKAAAAQKARRSIRGSWASIFNWFSKLFGLSRGG